MASRHIALPAGHTPTAGRGGRQRRPARIGIHAIGQSIAVGVAAGIVDLPITVGVAPTGFLHVRYPIVIAIGIAVIRYAVTIAVLDRHGRPAAVRIDAIGQSIAVAVIARIVDHSVAVAIIGTAFHRVRNTVVVTVAIAIIGQAISVTVWQRQRRSAAVRIDNVGQSVSIAVIVSAVDHAVAIGIVTATFHSIGQTIVVAVAVTVVRRAVAIAIMQRHGRPATIGIDAIGQPIAVGIATRIIDNTVLIGIISAGFDAVGYTVVVAVAIMKIG